MIKDILVFSRSEVRDLIQTMARLKCEDPWFLISIYSGTTGPLISEKCDFEILSSKGCIDYLPLEFHDITLQEYEEFKNKYRSAQRRFKLFSKRQARKILSEIKHLINDSRNVILCVHCEQGVSRSGAVGTFACRYLGLDEKRFRAMHPIIRPNPFVYDTLCEIANLKGTYERFWERKVPEHLQLIRDNHGV